MESLENKFGKATYCWWRVTRKFQLKFDFTDQFRMDLWDKERIRGDEIKEAWMSRDLERPDRFH